MGLGRWGWGEGRGSEPQILLFSESQEKPARDIATLLRRWHCEVLPGPGAGGLPHSQHGASTVVEEKSTEAAWEALNAACLKGHLYGLVTVAVLTHAQQTDGNQGQMPHPFQPPPSPWYNGRP